MYKDHLLAARCRRDSLLRECQEHSVPGPLIELLSIRRARQLAGSVGIGGFVAMVASAVCGRHWTGLLLVGTWLAMVVVFALKLLLTRWTAARDVRRSLRGTEDLFADLLQLDAGGPRGAILRELQRMEKGSFVLPVVALSLLVPLTMHYIIGTSLLDVRPEGFNHWVLLSLILVGHAHITLLIMSVVHVSRVSSEVQEGIGACGLARGFWALLWTITASAIPGAVFLFVPPVLVALTGLVFVPWMFLWVSYRTRTERRLLIRLSDQ